MTQHEDVGPCFQNGQFFINAGGPYTHTYLISRFYLAGLHPQFLSTCRPSETSIQLDFDLLTRHEMIEPSFEKLMVVSIGLDHWDNIWAIGTVKSSQLACLVLIGVHLQVRTYTATTSLSFINLPEVTSSASFCHLETQV